MGPGVTRFASSCGSVQSASKPRHWSSSRMFIGGRIDCRRPISNTDFHCAKRGYLMYAVGGYSIVDRFCGRPGASWNYRHPERGNPKSETRNPKQTPSTKQGMTKTTALLAVLRLGTVKVS